MKRVTCLVALAACWLLPVAAGAAELKVLTAGAFKQVVVALVPAFEARTGHKVDVQNDTAGALARRVASGERFDLLVVPPGSMQPLAAAGHVDPGSVVALARVGIGVAVKQGAPQPKMATVEDFKQALLAARKVAYIDPAAGGSSGIYLDGLFGRLGVADVVKPKAVLVPGGLVAERLVTGEADLAIHQVSEILPVAGAVLVAPLPADIQNYTNYSGAVAARSDVKDAARALLAALRSAEAASVIRSKGMEAAP